MRSGIRGSTRCLVGAYHNAEAQAQGAGEKSIAFLDAKVGLSGEHANENVDTDDRGSKDAGYTRYKVSGVPGAARLGADLPMPLMKHRIQPRTSLSSPAVAGMTAVCDGAVEALEPDKSSGSAKNNYDSERGGQGACSFLDRIVGALGAVRWCFKGGAAARMQVDRAADHRRGCKQKTGDENLKDKKKGCHQYDGQKNSTKDSTCFCLRKN